MGIVVRMLLDAERLALKLELHAEIDVERRIGLAQRRVVGILDEPPRELAVGRRIDVRADELGIEVLQTEELARAVDHRLALARAIDDHQRRDAALLGHPVVVGAERRRDMHDAGTVLGRHVVAGDDAERIAVGRDPREQRLVADACQVLAHVLALDTERYVFAAGLVAVHRKVFVLLREIGRAQVFGQKDGKRSARIGIERPHAHVADSGPHGQRRVRGQRPGRRRPCHEVHVAVGPVEQPFALLVAHDAEQGRAGRVLHVAVTAGLVQLVIAETRTGRRRVRLNRIALVKKPLLVQFGKQMPQRLDILVVIGDVRVLHIDPVAHPARQPLPCVGIGHHLPAADAVVLLDRYFRPDILLRDAELLLDAQLDGQSVRIPSGFAMDQKAPLGLVAADDVLDRAGHHMVDTRHAVGRGRSLVKHERRMPFAGRDAFAERIDGVPPLQHLAVDGREVEPFVFLEFRTAHS